MLPIISNLSNSSLSLDKGLLETIAISNIYKNVSGNSSKLRKRGMANTAKSDILWHLCARAEY